MIEFDLSQGVPLGQIDPANKLKDQKTICWNCGKKTGECQWLLHGKAYPGAEYYWQVASWAGGSGALLCTIVKCPEYVEPGQNKEEDYKDGEQETGNGSRDQAVGH